MEVILLEKIQNLGNLGEKVEVKPGYGRNYLLPTNKAVAASAGNLAAFEERRDQLESEQKTALDKATALAAELGELRIEIMVKAGSEGKLFGSVGTADITKAINAKGLTVRKDQVRLPTGTLREIGEHEVQMHLHADINATVIVQLLPEENAN